jgi:NAD(P)-dependent dehydrogenase (short-subunit alcohol dehydrogenase family)
MTTGAGRFVGKRALVTGASKGIGRSTALRLAAEGARVALIARHRPALDAAMAEITSMGGDCMAIEADCSIEPEIRSAIERVGSAWGGLDVVVSNAGIEIAEGSVDQEELTVWERLITTNLTGQFLTCKYGIRELLRSGGGSVVCLGSNLGFLGMADDEPGYSASKGGVFALMRVMASRYANAGIRVNMVVPGVIDTPMNDPLRTDPELRDRWLARVPMRRIGTPDEIASAIAWLASGDASYVTGAALVVDGGMSAA